MEFHGYDAWLAHNRHDNELGRSNGKPVPYRCLQCDWAGKGMMAASEHYRVTGHSAKPADDPRFTRKG
jgi:hypothetical protein